MFGRVSEKISDNMVKSGLVRDEDKELYLFGIQQGLILLLNIGTTIVMGLLSGTLLELAIFTIALIALRSYSGGYHAETPQRCYIVSSLVTAVAVFLFKYIVLNKLKYIILLVLSGAVIVIFSPVDSENNPLDELEKKIYRKRAVIICTAEVIFSAVLLYAGLEKIAVCIIWNLAAVSLLMVMAKITEFFKQLNVSNG